MSNPDNRAAQVLIVGVMIAAAVMCFLVVTVKAAILWGDA